MAHRPFEDAPLDWEPDPELFGPDQRLRLCRNFNRNTAGLGIQQLLRIGMPGAGKEHLRVCRFHQLTLGHHGHPVGVLSHNAQVVGDQQQRHPHAFLQPTNELEHLLLHRHIQGRGRLVGNQQLRLIGQRHGNHHPLPLPSGELMRVGVQPLLRMGNLHLFKQLNHTTTGLHPAESLMQEQHFAQLFFDRVQRVEAGHRLLKDHADVVSSNLTDAPFGGMQQVLSLKEDASRRVMRRGREQLENGVGSDRFPGAAFPHQRQRLARSERQRHPLNRPDLLFPLTEGHGQVFDLQQGLGHAQAPG